MRPMNSRLPTSTVIPLTLAAGGAIVMTPEAPEARFDHHAAANPSAAKHGCNPCGAKRACRGSKNVKFCIKCRGAGARCDVLPACRIPYQLDRHSRHNKEEPVQGPALLLTGVRPDLFISQHFLRFIHNVIRSINDAIDNILDKLPGLRAKQHILIRRFFFEGLAIDSLVKRATQHGNARLGCSRRCGKGAADGSITSDKTHDTF